MKGPDESGGPHGSEGPADERPAAEGADLARVLQFEVPWDGILNCGGDCVYGEDLRRLAPVVEIARRKKRQE